jgi:hypothetical protein
MNAQSTKTMDRLTELLADEAIGRLEPAEREELEALMAGGAGLKRDEFMRVAGLVQIGLLDQDRPAQQRMPSALRERLLREGQAMFASRQAQNDPVRPGNVTPIGSAADKRNDSSRSFSTMAAAGGWLLAAMLAIAFVVVRNDFPGADPSAIAPASLAEQRDALMKADDVVVAQWNPPEAAGYEGVRGDVVWSDAEQRGYMRLAGMPANNPAQVQYQLWIVDPDRDTNPVDGGVFNIPAGASEVLIPIDAKLAVNNPAAFAITAEQPGGVVVSAGPLLVVAPAS